MKDIVGGALVKTIMVLSHFASYIQPILILVAGCQELSESIVCSLYVQRGCLLSVICARYIYIALVNNNPQFYPDVGHFSILELFYLASPLCSFPTDGQHIPNRSDC
jgi:hypothetical protein